MYNQIAQNKRNTVLLMGIFVALLVGVGSAVAYLQNIDTSVGIVYALVISLGMTTFSYFFGDKLVLSTTGARRIESRDQYPYLWNMVENLSITSGQPMPAIYVIEDNAPNAFATGRNPQTASIAVTTGIVSLLENEELEGVLAHELSHVKNRDTLYLMMVAVLLGGITLLADYLFRGGFRRSRRDEGGGLFMIVGIALLILAPLIGQIIKFAVSRQREYLADASGALLTRYPEGLASALEKIGAHAQPLQRAPEASAHLWISSPTADRRSLSQRVSGLFATHPPIADRVARLRKMV